MNEVLIRVYKEGFFMWWAELWRERLPTDPPAPDRKIMSYDAPDDLAGYYRFDLASACTKRGAKKNGLKLRELYWDNVEEKDWKEEIL